MDKSTIIEVPVLFIGFNRPEIFRQCIAKIRESKPTNLYFACDGARKEKRGEESQVTEVRSIMENEIDWPCEKHYRYNDLNKGCELTESEAITWVLEGCDNEYVIVIEDDIIAPYSFLKFAQEMLYRYKDNENVFQVTSDNVTPMEFPNNEDYCFSMYGHIWGWATWRRAWKHFNLYVNDFDDTAAHIGERTNFTDIDAKILIEFCKRLKSNMLFDGGTRSTWDVVWGYVKLRDGGLSIIPRVHLSSNVGVIGLHSKERTLSHFRPYDEEFEARIHPKEIKRNFLYDDYHYNKFLKQPFFLIRQWRRAWAFLRRNTWGKFKS